MNRITLRVELKDDARYADVQALRTAVFKAVAEIVRGSAHRSVNAWHWTDDSVEEPPVDLGKQAERDRLDRAKRVQLRVGEVYTVRYTTRTAVHVPTYELVGRFAQERGVLLTFTVPTDDDTGEIRWAVRRENLRELWWTPGASLHGERMFSPDKRLL